MRTTPLESVLDAVGGDRHEVDLAVQVEVAHQVAQEEERALEDADQEQVAAGVVARDLLAERADAVGQVVLLDEDPADGGVAHGDRADAIGAGAPSRAAPAPGPRGRRAAAAAD